MDKQVKIAIIAIAIIIPISAILVWNSNQSNLVSLETQNQKILIFASFYPYYEFAKNVAGDRAEVKQYLPGGVEAHNWEPSARDIQALKDADVFVYNGLGMEPYINNLIDSGEFDSVVFVNTSKGLNLIKSEDEENDLVWDPHVWLDPILIKQQINNIRNSLIQADPENTKQYEKNALEYNTKLDALDLKIRSSLADCNKYTVVPFHRAFTYFGEQYGLTVFSIGGLAPNAEASASEIAEFVDFVKDNDIKVIFAEELVDPRLAEVIANEAEAQVMIFSPIEALTSQEVSKGVTFLDKMEQNLDVLKVALECQ